jgi:hypothetical protein
LIKQNKSLFAGLFVAVVLSACGGGGSNSAAPMASAEGAYQGTVSGSPVAAAFKAVVLEDGEFWALYGNSIGAGIVVNGLIQGQGTSNNGSFTSSTLKDFGVVPSVPGTLNANYVPGVSMSGTVTEGAGSITINGTAIPATNFNYDAPAILSNITGNWSLSSTSGNVIALTIAANGTFAGVDGGGCSVSGTVAPRPSDKNIFNVQLTLGPAPCSLPGWVGGGIGIYTTLTNGTNQLIVASVDVSRTYGSIAFGTR